VIDRAREILVTLERKERDVVEETRKRGPVPTTQLSLFGAREQGVLDAIRALQVEAMSPIEALNVVHELQKRLRGDG
jgi:DNA mismatch repair ATPase MutS